MCCYCNKSAEFTVNTVFYTMPIKHVCKVHKKELENKGFLKNVLKAD